MSIKNVMLGGSAVLTIILIGSLVVIATYVKYAENSGDSITGLATGNTITEAQAASIASNTIKGNVGETELGKENGRLLYSVEITNEKGEHDVKIDAYTGEIVKIEVEDEVGKRELELVNPKITQEQARDIALGSFGGRVTGFEAKKLNGQYAYEVEITGKNAEADVLVDMMDGRILSIEQDSDEDDGSDENGLSQEELNNLQKAITQEQAIKIALNRVGGEVTDVEIERKSGREVYAVEIDDGGDEVDVFVDMRTGEIVGIERDDD